MGGPHWGQCQQALEQLEAIDESNGECALRERARKTVIKELTVATPAVTPSNLYETKDVNHQI